MRCECGCGLLTKAFRGKFARFVKGHHARGALNPRAGVRLTLEERQRISAARKAQGTPWWDGRRHTEAARAKMALSKQLPRPGQRLGRCVKCEVCSKDVWVAPSRERPRKYCSRSCNAKANCAGEKNPFFGKEHTVEAKEKQREAAIQQRVTGVVLPTRPERLVHEELSRRGIAFTTEVAIGFWAVDIYIPSLRTIIFVDGCYWHACPQHHPHRPRPRSDNGRIPYLSREYDVFVLWEHDILKDVCSIIQTILSKSPTSSAGTR